MGLIPVKGPKNVPHFERRKTCKLIYERISFKRDHPHCRLIIKDGVQRCFAVERVNTQRLHSTRSLLHVFLKQGFRTVRCLRSTFPILPRTPFQHACFACPLHHPFQGGNFQLGHFVDWHAIHIQAVSDQGFSLLA